ncbi:RNA polymerase sigma factor 54 interaction domain [Syntrophomonas zehnderi OL-4]|uniref:RNA polymerase sigma factor 54 interaction domain n=1 Tax=Syntrophomonas zehnderi OL-4 TaxID=690567 RepID=A0A0E4C960_9FIRM|nr:sigma 54-interacting transcriptional regulator [Syntrophomonas zehnderi]CFX86876.1 RNA polymerase sigma factor 54 interaction domain [Syntrophomonas zehnderi OL-4]
MITLSRENKLETLWDDIKHNHVIPEEIRLETEQNLLRNRLELNVGFYNQRVKEDDLQQKLEQSYETIALVSPLLKDISSRLDKNTRMIVTDPHGVIISCHSDDVIGYCCPAAELVNNNHELKDLVQAGKAVEVNYDNGIRSQLVPIFDESGEIQFYWGLSDSRPISVEMSNILYLAAQLVQQRYKYMLMIDEYTSSFMNAIPECAVLLDENARVINVNAEFLRLLAIPDKNVFKGMHISSLIAATSPGDDLYAIQSEHRSRFNLRLWDNEIPCHVISKQVINTPYSDQMIILFNELNDRLLPAQPPVTSRLPANVSPFDTIIGDSAEINQIKSIAKRAARTAATVLLEGESGTGKELFALAIHQESQRVGQFIAINCGAIPAELIQSELFGYEEGAFTGAKRRGSPGKFEMADGGTVFLDEIGEMPVDMQVSLLRFLQDKTVTRVGGHQTKKVDVRIIAATNRNLQDEVNQGKFREDLYYRLNVINIQIPPLRQRREDIPLIADYLLAEQCRQNNLPRLKLKPREIEILSGYDWPGNARELANTIERAFILRQGEDLNLDNLPGNRPTKNSSRQEIKEHLEQMEKEALEEQLRIYNGNITHTANALGITRQTLYRKIKAFNIDRMQIKNG